MTRHALDRMLKSTFPGAVERVREAATGSRRAARVSQDRVRSSRISSTQNVKIARPESDEADDVSGEIDRSEE